LTKNTHMGARIRRQIGESKTEKRIKEFVVGQLMQMRQFVNDGALFHEGSREQLMYQLGQAMTVQAGIIEWLDKQFGRPGFTPSDQIAAIVQVNVAAARAAREEREAEAKRKAEEEAAKAAKTPCECCGAPGNTGSMPYGIYCDACGKDVTHPTGDGSCFVRDGREHKGRRAGYCEACGWYPPIDSDGVKTPGHVCQELPASAYRSIDDPALGAPANIAPAAPADAAPAQPIGDA